MIRSRNSGGGGVGRAWARQVGCQCSRSTALPRHVLPTKPHQSTHTSIIRVRNGVRRDRRAGQTQPARRASWRGCPTASYCFPSFCDAAGQSACVLDDPIGGIENHDESFWGSCPPNRNRISVDEMSSLLLASFLAQHGGVSSSALALGRAWRSVVPRPPRLAGTMCFSVRKTEVLRGTGRPEPGGHHNSQLSRPSVAIDAKSSCSCQVGRSGPGTLPR